jgi:hypothetical protein
MGVTLFDHFFDTDLKQRRDIQGAAAAAGEARYFGALALDTIEQLRKQVLSQRDEIRDLSIAISVLVKMLSEHGTVDDKVLRYRVEAALEERIEASQVMPTVACVQCQNLVPAAQTQLTAFGAVCDRCATGVK